VVPSRGDAYARVRLDRPAAVTRGDRFVLRALSPASTIGGAIVLDPEAPSAGLRRSGAFLRFRQIDVTPSASAAQFVRVILGEAGVRGLSTGDLIRRAGLDPTSAPHIVNQIATSQHGMVAAGRLFDAEVAEACKVRVVEALAQFHDAHPREPDMPRERLRDAVARGGAQELFDVVVSELTTRGVIRGTDRLVLASQGAGLSSRDAKIQEVVERTLRDAGLAPPDGVGLSAATGISPVELEPLVRRLIREDRVTRIGDLLFHTEALDRLRADLRALKAASNGNMADVGVGAFKERYGLSRKFAIPLLEWLDRQRVTRRLGDRRVLL
jgi:selenocysteine-specific elongation factor